MRSPRDYHQNLDQDYASKTMQVLSTKRAGYKFFEYSSESSGEDDGEVVNNNKSSILFNKMKLGGLQKIIRVKTSINKQGKKNSEDLILKMQAEKIRHPFILKYDSRKKLIWDGIIICLTIYNSIFIPFKLAFNPDFTKVNGYITWPIIIDLFFLFDILVNFRTSTANILTGEEINDPKLIARKYMFSLGFALDVLSCLRSILQPRDETLALFGMCKVIRLTKIGKIIDTLNSVSKVKTILKLINMYFYLLLYLHVLACAIYYIMGKNKTWLPPSESLTLGYGFYETDDLNLKYWTVMYYSVLMYLVNETAPTVLYERQFVQFVAIFSVIVNTNIFGTIAVLVGDLNRKQVEFQEQQDSASTAMSDLQLPMSIQQNVKDYMLVTQLTKDEPQELSDFLGNISESLRQKVQIYVMSRVLKDNSVIMSVVQSNMLTTLDLIVSKMTLELTSPEEVLLRENEALEKNDNMFFIAIGTCIVEQKDRLSEVALLYNCKRSTTVFSDNYSTLAKLSYEKFHEILQLFPKLEVQMKIHIKTYNDPQRLFIKACLDRVPHFEFLKEDDKNSLQFNFDQINFKKGDHLQRPGDIPKYMMIIQQGTAQIFTKFNSKADFPIAYFRRGSVINHTLFLFEQPALLPIICLTEIQVLVISLEKVKYLRSKHENSSLNVELNQLEQKQSQIGFNKLYLDYVISPLINQEDLHNVKVLNAIGKRDKRSESTRQLKNAAIYLLADFREKNKKPQVNEILAKMIQERKDLIKAQKQQMGDLMNQQISKKKKQKNGEQDDKEPIVMQPKQVKEIQEFLKEIEKNIIFQQSSIDHLEQSVNFYLTDGAFAEKQKKLDSIRKRTVSNRKATRPPINKNQRQSVADQWRQKDFVDEDDMNWIVQDQQNDTQNQRKSKIKPKQNYNAEDEELKQLEDQIGKLETTEEFKYNSNSKLTNNYNSSGSGIGNYKQDHKRNDSKSKLLEDDDLKQFQQVMLQNNKKQDSFSKLNVNFPNYQDKNGNQQQRTQGFEPFSPASQQRFLGNGTQQFNDSIISPKYNDLDKDIAALGLDLDISDDDKPSNRKLINKQQLELTDKYNNNQQRKTPTSSNYNNYKMASQRQDPAKNQQNDQQLSQENTQPQISKNYKINETLWQDESVKY
eukprot:403363088